MKLNLDTLLLACADDSFEDGIRIDTDLEPLSGPGGPVKPAVYEGGKYQMDRRWASSDDDGPTDVMMIDNVPSQANRLEDALRRNRESIGIPELVLDLSGIQGLPVHLPSRLSSLQFPHRNADAYLRDSRKGDDDFAKTAEGKAILEATPWNCGALMSWFPQALLFGFWQSHLGKKGISTKHARAWVSEIVGWKPAATDTRTMGLKGDPMNLSVDEGVRFSPDDQMDWKLASATALARDKKGKLSEIGHGQIPFMTDANSTAAPVSFERITQRATLSFAQLRRVSLESAGNSSTEDAATQDAAARALLVRKPPYTGFEPVQAKSATCVRSPTKKPHGAPILNPTLSASAIRMSNSVNFAPSQARWGVLRPPDGHGSMVVSYVIPPAKGVLAWLTRRMAIPRI